MFLMLFVLLYFQIHQQQSPLFRKVRNNNSLNLNKYSRQTLWRNPQILTLRYGTMSIYESSIWQLLTEVANLQTECFLFWVMVWAGNAEGCGPKNLRDLKIILKMIMIIMMTIKNDSDYNSNHNDYDTNNARFKCNSLWRGCTKVERKMSQMGRAGRMWR